MPALSAPPSRPEPSRSARPSPRPTPPTPSPIYRLPADALLVGPGHKYAKPCQAIAAAKPGATIGIDAKGNGTYDGDVCAWSTDRLTIAGFNGMAHIDAAGHNAQGKATWVIAGDHTTIRDVELSGSAVPDNNGAGIRQEGAGLTVIDCYFHDNQDGILAGDNPASDIVIEDSEFARNGAGDGYSHNMYINHVRSFTLEGSWSHDARVGHLVKSRALVNHILYNRITGQGGTDSYEIDLPNGGLSDVIGNVIEQGSGDAEPGDAELRRGGQPEPGLAPVCRRQHVRQRPRARAVGGGWLGGERAGHGAGQRERGQLDAGEPGGRCVAWQLRDREPEVRTRGELRLPAGGRLALPQHRRAAGLGPGPYTGVRPTHLDAVPPDDRPPRRGRLRMWLTYQPRSWGSASVLLVTCDCCSRGVALVAPRQPCGYVGQSEVRTADSERELSKAEFDVVVRVGQVAYESIRLQSD